MFDSKLVKVLKEDNASLKRRVAELQAKHDQADAELKEALTTTANAVKHVGEMAAGMDKIAEAITSYAAVVSSGNDKIAHSLGACANAVDRLARK